MRNVRGGVKLGEMKQSEAPPSRRTRVGMEFKISRRKVAEHAVPHGMHKMNTLEHVDTCRE